MAKKPEIEDYIIYFTVGALAGKFVEVLLNIQPDKLWWVSFISGGILGLIVLNRKRLSK